MENNIIDLVKLVELIIRTNVSIFLALGELMAIKEKLCWPAVIRVVV